MADESSQLRSHFNDLCRRYEQRGRWQFSRFLTQAESCLSHDAWEDLPRIFCPTLVIGGSVDKIVTVEGSRELAERIVGAELKVCEGLSHALYEEEKDFLDQVAAFCLK